jgi:hypothetical protein
MAQARMGPRLAVGGLLLWGTALVAAAAPTAEDMLKFRPKQDGVIYTTPAGADKDSCKVEGISRQGKTIGWLLRDKDGKVLRRFFDTAGTGKTDAWCYYLNGVEVYREIYSGQGDHYRWLNGAGMKYGIDLNRDGKIDTWRMISAEEVSQEVLLAVVKKDYSRIQALMLSEAEIKSLELPADEVKRIREAQKNAPAKFQETVAKLGALGDKIRWVHLEAAPPQCTPADSTGMKADMIKYAQATVTYINEANNQPADLQIGEMILVGQAWRLIDAPVPSSAESSGSSDTSPAPTKELQALLDELKSLDDKAPKPDAPPAELAQYNLKRADILGKIADYFTKPDLKAEEKAKRDEWVRQQADCLSAAAQNAAAGDKTAYERLVALKDRIVKEQPGSNLAGHVVFCEMSADYAAKLNDGKDIAKLQKDWVERLAQFVQDYPRCEDTPDALLQLGMVSELIGEEEKAKKWYELLIKDFPSSPQAEQAKGALRRLELVGKELELVGTPLGGGATFDLKTLKGKVVVVYYWASWNQQSGADFAKLKSLLGTYAAKGMEVVCVNLDDNPAAATSFLQKNPAAGVQLYEQGGLASKLAKPYGIQVLPTLFLVGKDNKVLSRTVQMTNVEDEVKKALDAK